MVNNKIASKYEATIKNVYMKAPIDKSLDDLLTQVLHAENEAISEEQVQRILQPVLELINGL
ncbi:MAG: hypothetical protein FWH40_05450 [Coriobacteriia bacterium]|nr:hypothetical protein [Coriobacteriia bacterium]